MKQLVRSFLAKFGVEVRRVPKGDPPQPPGPAPWELVQDAIAHNSRENMDAWWARPSAETDLLSDEQMKFYCEVIEAAQTEGAAFTGKAVADVGCGTGVLLTQICKADKPSSVSGYDFSEKALDVCRRNMPEGEFSAYDVYEAPPRVADVVFCTEVLEHLLHPDIALMNLTRMCKPGGYLIITVPNGRADTFKGHINFWSLESWGVFIDQVSPVADTKAFQLAEGGLCAVIRKH